MELPETREVCIAIRICFYLAVRRSNQEWFETIDPWNLLLRTQEQIFSERKTTYSQEDKFFFALSISNQSSACQHKVVKFLACDF